MKKKILLAAIAIVFAVNIQAQRYSNYSYSTYFGVGTGVNSPYGLLGIRANQRIVNSIYLDCAMGLGTWGNKLSAGLVYQSQNVKGWSGGLSYSYASGVIELELDIEARDTVTDMYFDKNVLVDLKPAHTINVFAQHHWAFSNGNRLFLEAGMAFVINNEAYEATEKSMILTEESKDLMDVMQPGGILLSIGYAFALR